MAKQLGCIGGFTGFNTGYLYNCYSDVKLTAGELSSGFCGENRGMVARCFSKGPLHRQGKAKGAGFCARQSGTVEDCFWVARGKNSSARDWSDWTDAIPREKLDALLEQRTASWDRDHVWSLRKNELLLHKTPLVAFAGCEVIEIGSREALERAAKEINSGAGHNDAIYRLTRDIDLGGRDWTPLGLDQNNAFGACFDGSGHTIRNFRIRAKDNTYAAFFGCIGRQGEVHDLNLDGIVVGRGMYTAGFCALNDGLIRGCEARMAVGGGRYTGGFCAQNNGRIESSCVAGHISPVLVFPWQRPLAALLLLFCLLPVLFGFLHHTKGADVFAPVIMDPNAKPIAPDDPTIPTPPKEELTDSSVSFVMNADMRVGVSNYTGTIGLRCPSWSKKAMVATAVVHGRELQQNGSSYTRDAVVYESGLISPGMGVDVITLSKLPDGSRMPAGNYTLTVNFAFYDPETNEKAAVTSSAPLDVRVDPAG